MVQLISVVLRSLVELTRFRVSAFPLNDEATAERFGLEIARLLVDVYYRELVTERYETEKGLFNGAAVSGSLS